MPNKYDDAMTRRFELELLNKGLTVPLFCAKHHIERRVIHNILHDMASPEHHAVSGIKAALRAEGIDPERGMERVRRPYEMLSLSRVDCSEWCRQRRADLVRLRLGLSITDVANGTRVGRTTVYRLLSGFTLDLRRRWAACRAGAKRESIAAYLKRRGATAEELSSLWEPAEAPVFGNEAPKEFRHLLEEGSIMLSAEALDRWKLEHDPFGELAQEGQDIWWGRHQKKAAAALKRAVREQYFCGLIGPVGSGKTELWRHVQRELSDEPGGRHTFVTLRDPTQERVTPQQVVDALLEVVHGRLIGGANRQKRLRTLIDGLKAQRNQGRMTTLVVEEGQLLSDTILRTFKGLTELCDGFAKLIGIILIAQTQLDQVLRSTTVEEVRRRLRVITYAGIDHNEIAKYLDLRFAWVGSSVEKCFEPSALEAMKNPDWRQVMCSPLGLGNVASQALEIALYRGHAKATNEDIEEAMRRGDKA